jgi:hypothetical protein
LFLLFFFAVLEGEGDEVAGVVGVLPAD